MSVLGTIALTIGSMALPYIMEAIGGKVSANAGRHDLTTTETTRTPMLTRAGVPYKDGRMTTTSRAITTPTLKSKMMRGGGTALSFLGNAGIMALPFIFDALGKTTQAAGAAGGAVAQAIGNAPAHFAASMDSQAVKDWYGGTPLDAVGGIMSDVGTAAGVGVSGAANAIGSTVSDAANAARLARLLRTGRGETIATLEALQRMNLDPSTARAFESMETSSRSIRGH